MPGGVEMVADTINWCVRCAAMGHDLVDTASQGSDWGVISAGAVLSDGLALHAVLGAGDRDGGTCGIAQAGKGGCVGDFASSTVPEGDVLDRKWDGEFGFLRTWFGEFAHTEQIEKGNVGEVGDGLLFEGGEGAVGVSPAVAEDALDDGDGDGQLGLMGWVLELEILECPF